MKALSNELFIDELNQSLSLYQTSSQSSSQSSSSIFPPFIDRLYQITNNEWSSLSNLLIFAANQHDPIKQPPKIIAVVGDNRVSFPLNFSQARWVVVLVIIWVIELSDNVNDWVDDDRVDEDDD